MRHLTVIGCVLVACILVPDAARACDCATLPTCHGFWNATAVFVGRVVSMDSPGGHTLEVLDRFRGPVAVRETVVILPRSNCAYPFVVGESYLVFAYEAAPGVLEVTLCSGTQLLKSAARDLAYARSTRSVGPSTRGRIEGTVELLDADGNEQPLPPGTSVTATAREGHRVTATVNSRREYRFNGLPLGVYTLTASAPGGYVSDSDEVTVNDGRPCGRPIVYLDYGGRVTGRVIDSGGRPLAGVPLVLVQLRNVDSAEAPFRRKHSRSDLDGTFAFERIAPSDSYVLALDSTGFGSAAPTLPRAFFPSVVSLSQAAPLSVARNGQLLVRDFMIPGQIALVAIHGIAVDPGGAPMSNTEVTLGANGQSIGLLVRTAADGRFVFAGQAGQTYSVFAKKYWPETGATQEVWSAVLRIKAERDMAPIRVVLEK